MLMLQALTLFVILLLNRLQAEFLYVPRLFLREYEIISLKVMRLFITFGFRNFRYMTPACVKFD